MRSEDMPWKTGVVVSNSTSFTSSVGYGAASRRCIPLPSVGLIQHCSLLYHTTPAVGESGSHSKQGLVGQVWG